MGLGVGLGIGFRRNGAEAGRVMVNTTSATGQFIFFGLTPTPTLLLLL